MLTRRIVYALAAFVAAGWWLTSRPTASAGAGEPFHWQSEPRQSATERQPFTVPSRRGRVTLVPRAAYDLGAVVLSRERYHLDASAFLSPLDLAVAWGEAAEAGVRERFSIYQGGRFFTWSTRDASLDLGRLAGQMANVHVIPATPNVRRALLGIGREDVVRLSGLLVDAEAPDGFRWATSLSRSDDGAGSCELLFVEEVQVDSRVYR
jgi:hypothetical protein